MTTLTRIILILSFGLATTNLMAQKSGNSRAGSVPQGGVLKSGPLPELDAFTADGKPIKLRDLCKGGYTVLKPGCLT